VEASKSNPAALAHEVAACNPGSICKSLFHPGERARSLGGQISCGLVNLESHQILHAGFGYGEASGSVLDGGQMQVL
jgi:hypothetical protein